MPNKKILIIGASGFTGQHAVQFFKNKGYDVFGTSRGREREKFIYLDVTNRKAVFRFIKAVKCDYILYLAGQNMVKRSWESPLTTFDINLSATLNLLEACRMHQPSVKILIAGSALEDDSIKTTTHPYGMSKALQSQVANQWARLFNLNIVIVKPTNLIGPGFANGVCSLFAKQIAEMEMNDCVERRLTIMNRAIKRDFLDVRDAVSAYEILLREGKTKTVYELGTGNEVSLLQVAEVFRELTDYPFLLDIREQPSQLTISPVNIGLITELGWKRNFSLRQSLLDSLNFYRQNI